MLKRLKIITFTMSNKPPTAHTPDDQADRFGKTQSQFPSNRLYSTKAGVSQPTGVCPPIWMLALKATSVTDGYKSSGYGWGYISNTLSTPAIWKYGPCEVRKNLGRTRNLRKKSNSVA